MKMSRARAKSTPLVCLCLFLTGCSTYEVWETALAGKVYYGCVEGVSKPGACEDLAGEHREVILAYSTDNNSSPINPLGTNPLDLIQEYYDIAVPLDDSSSTGPLFYRGNLSVPEDVVAALPPDQRSRVALHRFSRDQFRKGRAVVESNSYWEVGSPESRMLVVNDCGGDDEIAHIPYWDPSEPPRWHTGFTLSPDPDPSGRKGILLVPRSQPRPLGDRVVGIGIAAVETPILFVTDIILVPTTIVLYLVACSTTDCG